MREDVLLHRECGRDRDQWPGLTEEIVAAVFTLHMMGAITGAGPYVEFTIEGSDYYPWQDGLFEPALIARDGKVRIPDGPGWGVEIDKGWLEKAEYAISDAKA